MGAGKRKRKVLKTLYVENCGNPLRMQLTEETLKRVRKLKAMIDSLPLRKNESVGIDLHLRKGIIQINKDYIDIGAYGYEGWDSYITEMELRKGLEEIPKVYFSSMFLYYMKDDLREGTKEKFNKLILPKHKELIIWKKIEGSA